MLADFAEPLRLGFLLLAVAIDEVGAVVLDIGSHTFKAGFAGEDSPKVKHAAIEVVAGV